MKGLLKKKKKKYDRRESRTIASLGNASPRMCNVVSDELLKSVWVFRMCDKVISKNLIHTPAIVSYVGVKHKADSSVSAG